MPGTPTYNFPYPSLTDDPNVPADMQLLAQAIEDEIERVDNNVSLVLGATQAFTTAVVATAETTTSTAYTDLATIGPSVNLTTGTFAICWFAASMWQATASDTTGVAMAIDVGGATSIAAGDGPALIEKGMSATGIQRRASMVQVFTTLNPGVNFFTAKYRTTSGANAAGFATRRIIVFAPTATLIP